MKIANDGQHVCVMIVVMCVCVWGWERCMWTSVPLRTTYGGGGRASGGRAFTKSGGALCGNAHGSSRPSELYELGITVSIVLLWFRSVVVIVWCRYCVCVWLCACTVAYTHGGMTMSRDTTFVHTWWPDHESEPWQRKHHTGTRWCLGLLFRLWQYMMYYERVLPFMHCDALICYVNT